MKCKEPDCEREARYKSEQLCQKHYFRLWRYGTTQLMGQVKKEKLGYSRIYRITMPGRGYQRLYEPNHPFADKSGYVSEHRMVVYAKYGDNLPNCEICGKASSWVTSHIDHIDNNPKNNDIKNLRPLCPGCNTWREMPPSHTFQRCMALTFEGKTDTPHGWSKDSRVKACGATIRRRKLQGMSDFDALFSEKLTHNGKKPIKKPRPPSSTRKNSINICIDGITKTSAEWSRDEKCNVSDATLRNRVKSNWNHDVFILKRLIK